MKAVLDETYPELANGILYVVAATIVVTDEATTKAALDKVLTVPGRTRPFHWNQEGPQAKANMMNCLEEVAAVTHVCVHSPTGRKKTGSARARSLRRILPLLLADGVDDLVIESRSTIDDQRDKKVILDVLKELGRPGGLRYDWHSKRDPMMWMADAVCGAVRGYLLADDAAYYHRLQASGVITELVYINETSP